MTDQLDGPRMLALVADRSGPSLWRAMSPFSALARAGYPARWAYKDADGIGNLAPAFDGFVLPRLAWRPEQRRLAEHWFGMLRSAGRFTVYDADDDLFTSELTHRTIALGWSEGRSFAELEAERFERIWAMQQCDGVTVSTQRLATVVRSFTTKPVVVVPNAIDLRWFRDIVRKTTRQTAGVTIGWAGGRRPDEDLAAVAAAWARIAERHPDVRFVVQGHVSELIPGAVPADRLVVVPWMDVTTYPAGLVEVDVACCAVADTRFNRCKTPIKAWEAAAAGAAVVATPTLYGSTIEHGVSGYLAETADDWTEALSALVVSASRRSMMARRLRRHVERHWSLRENLWRWPQAWQQIAEDARSRRKVLVTT